MDVAVAGVTRDIRARVADGASLVGAFALTRRTYVRAGYEPADDGKPLRVTEYHAVPGVVVLTALAEGRVVATLTALPDSVVGVPAEKVFPAELASLRAEGRPLFEMIALASETLSVREFVATFDALVRIGFQVFVGRDRQVRCLMTVNPSHSAFYRQVYGARRLGETAAHPTVGGAPADLYLVDEEGMWAVGSRMYAPIFHDRLPAAVLDVPPIHVGLLRAAASLSSATTPEELDRVLALTRRDQPERPE